MIIIIQIKNRGYLVASHLRMSWKKKVSKFSTVAKSDERSSCSLLEFINTLLLLLKEMAVVIYLVVEGLD